MLFEILLAAAIGATVGWLVDPGKGVPHEWPDAPGGALKFRLRFGSPLAALLWVGRKQSNCGLALWGVVHIRERWVSPALLAHELGHLVRMRGRAVPYVIRYVVDPTFRREEERACWEFAGEYADAEMVLATARATFVA